jgi:hypothetical protein
MVLLHWTSHTFLFSITLYRHRQRLVDFFNRVYLELWSRWYCKKVSFVFSDVSHSFISTNIQEGDQYAIDIDRNKVWLHKIKYLACF